MVSIRQFRPLGKSVDETDTPVAGDVLKYNAAKDQWDAQPGSSASLALNDLTDVTITAPAPGEYLRKGAGDFVNVVLQEIDLPTGIAKSKVAAAGTWANAEIANLSALGTLPSPARPTSITDAEHTARATNSTSPVNPTGTISSTGVMMGLAGSITPTFSGKVLIIITGNIQNSVLAKTSSVQIRTGTGTAPINGAALTGTTRGTLKAPVSPVAATPIPFALSWVVTGLTLSTAYWIDVGLAAQAGAANTASITGVDIAVIELG